MDPTGNSCKSKGEVLANNKMDVTSNPKDKGIENYSNAQNQPDRPSAVTPNPKDNGADNGRTYQTYTKLNPVTMRSIQVVQVD